MLYTIFDIETTGLSSTSATIVQFAYITVDQSLKPVRAHNYYYYYEGMPWSSEAEAVHGLSRDFLKQFADQYDENLLKMYTVLQRGNLVGHNSNAFDIPFANHVLIQAGLPALSASICFDTMVLWRKTFGRKMKLVELPTALGVAENRIMLLAKSLFKEQAGDLRPHDACYDVTATYFCLKEAVKRGLCSMTPAVTPSVAPVSISI